MESCPLTYAIPNAPGKADVLGTGLMAAVGRRTEHAGQTTITPTGLHAHFEHARAALSRVSALLQAAWFSGLGERFERFERFGLEMALGLSRGLTNGAQAVKNAVLGATDSVTNWFKERLGINSPSGVFAELEAHRRQLQARTRSSLADVD